MTSPLVTPGLFDLQVNGFAGIDFNDDALIPAALDTALGAMLATGVTQCLPTLITAPEPTLRARLRALDAAVAASRLGPSMVPGYHLEGPFLNPAPGFRGCHPPDAMVPPDLALLHRLLDGLRRPVRLLTLAPELLGATPLIAWCAAHGILVAIGHADAPDPVTAAAASAGARMSTHLGNGLPPVLPKLANPLMAQLAEDRLAASFIADGIHLPVAALRVMVRAKGPGRAILVTDAVSAAAASPGRYGFAGMTIIRHPDGSVRTPTGTLAGSALTLDRAVQNLVAWGIADPSTALAMASTTPAALLGLEPQGRINWVSSLEAIGIKLGDTYIGHRIRSVQPLRPGAF